MTAAEQFLRALKEDEKLRGSAKEKEPEPGQSKEDAMTALAHQFGFKITKEELMAALQKRKEQIEAARAEAGKAAGELREAELAAVSGGLCDSNYYERCTEHQYHDDRCDDTFREGEWCWTNDWCDAALICYGNWGML